MGSGASLPSTPDPPRSSSSSSSLPFPRLDVLPRRPGYAILYREDELFASSTSQGSGRDYSISSLESLLLSSPETSPIESGRELSLADRNLVRQVNRGWTRIRIDAPFSVSGLYAALSRKLGVDERAIAFITRDSEDGVHILADPLPPAESELYVHLVSPEFGSEEENAWVERAILSAPNPQRLRSRMQNTHLQQASSHPKEESDCSSERRDRIDSGELDSPHSSDVTRYSDLDIAREHARQGFAQSRASMARIERAISDALTPSK